MSTNEHTMYMQMALQLAARGRFNASPNPMVGCLIVKNDQIVGQGYHQLAGEAHAEIHALRQAGEKASAATVYLTLEPCCHQGKTPPCTTALIAAGVKKVYVATPDRNPLVANKGIKALQTAGVEVEVGLLNTEATQLNEIFFHYMTHQRPFVIAKWAMSLDGKTCVHPHDSRDISSPATQQASHAIRQQVDAILVGAKTVICDNPRLTTRFQHPDIIRPKHPIRIILSTHGKLPSHLQIFEETMPAKTIIATTTDMDASLEQLAQHKSVEILVLPKNERGWVDLPSLLKILGQRGITSLLVEGGMTVHESFFAANLVNKIHVYIAPVIIGNLEKKQACTHLTVTPIESDFICTTTYGDYSHV